MHIEHVIEKYLGLVLKGDKEVADLGLLLKILDELSFHVQEIDCEFDSNEYPEPPKLDYLQIREVVRRKFPTLGFYNSVTDVSTKICETNLAIGDAIDDIVDIVIDLQDALWRFHNTSVQDALSNLAFEYRSHWGRHLRELQLYLHDRWW